MIINCLNKKIVFLGVSILVFYAAFFSFINFRAKNYSDDGMLRMESRWKDKTNDLCQYSINGELIADNYIKLWMYCRDGRMAINTLAYDAFEDKSVENILDNYFKIIGYVGSKNIRCKVDSVEVADMRLVVENKKMIECYEE